MVKNNREKRKRKKYEYTQRKTKNLGGAETHLSISQSSAQPNMQLTYQRLAT